MTRQIIDGRIDVYEPGNTSTSAADADLQVPSSDINGVEISSRIQDLVDSATFSLDNDNGGYTGAITSGDRLRFYTQLDGESSLTHRWTGMARSPTISELGAKNYGFELEADDFVFGVLDVRQVTNTFDNRQISGTSDSVLETVLTNNASEINQSGISTISNTISPIFQSKPLLDVVNELADRGNALVCSDGKTLDFTPIGDLSSNYVIENHDVGLAENQLNDDDLTNQVRVDGATAEAKDDVQTTQNSYQTVTDSNRVTVQLDVAKSTITSIEIYTRKTGSGDNLVARLQRNTNGSPRDVSNTEADIVNKTLESDFIDTDGYTTFIMGDHTIPDPDPWLIIESEGSSGQDIGTDGSGNPAYKSYYEYPLVTAVPEQASIDKYRRREDARQRENVTSLNEVNSVAKAVLRHNDEPNSVVTAPAESVKTHNLKTGDIVTLDKPNIGATGDYVVVKKDDSYDGINLETQLQLKSVETI